MWALDGDGRRDAGAAAAWREPALELCSSSGPWDEGPNRPESTCRTPSSKGQGLGGGKLVAGCHTGEGGLAEARRGEGHCQRPASGEWLIRLWLGLLS